MKTNSYLLASTPSLTLMVGFVFAAIIPTSSEAKPDYEIKNNIAFEMKESESTISLVHKVQMQKPIGYERRVEPNPFDDSDNVKVINADGKEIGRITIVPAGTILANKRAVELDYDATLRVFVNFMTADPLLNQCNTKWLYFGHSRVNDCPVIYGVANYCINSIDRTVYISSNLMRLKLLYFFGKQQLYKIMVIFPENNAEQLEPVFDSIIGSIVLPEK